MEKKENNFLHGLAGVLLFIFGLTLIFKAIAFTLHLGFTGNSSGIFSGDEDYSDFKIVFWGTIISAIIFFVSKRKN